MNRMDWKTALWPEWEVVGEIGSGSFGTVYEIRREDMGGTYHAALKVIQTPQNEEELLSVSSSHPDPAQVQDYFRRRGEELSREIALMERMKGCSNIVSYEDHKIVSMEVGFLLLIRMELLTPLWTWLQNHPCNESAAIQMGIDIANALELCHRERLCHRDVKPGNIFVSRFGTCKLGDFGISRVLSRPFTNASTIGTYHYMAPEMYRGGPYDQTIDLYALGLVLYQMVNGGRGSFLPPPPAQLTPELVEQADRKRLSGRPLEPPAGASAPLWGVLQKVCAFRPEDRYASARELRMALERVQSGDGVLLHLEPGLRREEVTALSPVPETHAPEDMRDFFSPAGQL